MGTTRSPDEWVASESGTMAIVEVRLNMSRCSIPLWAVAGLSIGCAKVDEAPKEYESAVAYVFSHFEDEDPTELVDTIDFLDEWLVGADLDAAQEGLAIQNLSNSAVADLEGHAHQTSGLEGVSLATESRYPTCTLMEALTQYSFARMMPDVYITYDREFDEGQDCIANRDCLWAEGSVYSVADWGLLGEVTAERQIQYRWVQTAAGWAFLQRWWLTDVSTGTRLGLTIDDQYYVGINFPAGNGTRRVHASWLTMEMATGDASSGASKQLIKNWKKDASDLDGWIAENL